jgi:hypothetical protein
VPQVWRDGRSVTWRVDQGDCLDVMAAMPEASVDAIVTDPPYNLSFMAKPWDSYKGQEDAGFAYWLSGLIDGEGHFAIKAHTRGSHAPGFTLKLRADEEGTVRLIHRTLRIGIVSFENRGDANPMVKWCVQDKEGCQRLVDLLDKYPLRAKKRVDYTTWREAASVRRSGMERERVPGLVSPVGGRVSAALEARRLHRRLRWHAHVSPLDQWPRGRGVRDPRLPRLDVR